MTWEQFVVRTQLLGAHIGGHTGYISYQGRLIMRPIADEGYTTFTTVDRVLGLSTKEEYATREEALVLIERYIKHFEESKDA